MNSHNILISRIEENRKKNTNSVKYATGNFIVALFTVLSSLGLLGYTLDYKIPPQIIQLSETGSMFTKTPLNLPTKTDKELKQWFVDSISETFDFSYRNMDTHPTTLSNIYSPDALANIDKFINASNFSARVRNQFGIVEVVIADEVKITEGGIGGRLAWELETKAALMIYINGRPLRAAVYNVTARIVREDESTAPSGITIHTIILKENQ